MTTQPIEDELSFFTSLIKEIIEATIGGVAVEEAIDEVTGSYGLDVYALSEIVYAQVEDDPQKVQELPAPSLTRWIEEVQDLLSMGVRLTATLALVAERHGIESKTLARLYFELVADLTSEHYG